MKPQKNYPISFNDSKTAISEETEDGLSPEDASIFKALLYFDIFKFPLTEMELWKYGSIMCRSRLKDRLDWWVSHGYILREGQYYVLNSLDDKAKQREEGEARVNQMWGKASDRARLIQKFPFVKAVFISGSISKGVVAEDGDVDFFIITKPGRLWLSRTLLAVFKKIFLLGSHRYFCINYFIDTEFLEIEEQNIYTATELATLIPMTGDQSLVDHFYESNDWIEKYFPNFSQSEVLFPVSKKGGFKRFSESVLTTLGANKLDSFGQWVTTTFWKLKFNNMRSEDFEVALKSSKHVSKHHPLYFQKKVLQAYDEKILRFENSCGLKLDL